MFSLHLMLLFLTSTTNQRPPSVASLLDAVGRTEKLPGGYYHQSLTRSLGRLNFSFYPLTSTDVVVPYSINTDADGKENGVCIVVATAAKQNAHSSRSNKPVVGGTYII